MFSKKKKSDEMLNDLWETNIIRFNANVARSALIQMLKHSNWVKGGTHVHTFSKSTSPQSHSLFSASSHHFILNPVPDMSHNTGF